MNAKGSQVKRTVVTHSPGATLLADLKKADITQAELATMMGRSPQYVSDIVKGKKRIDPLTAMELEEALDGRTAADWLAMELKYQKSQQAGEGSLRRKDVMEKYPFALEAVRQEWIPDSKVPEQLQENIQRFLNRAEMTLPAAHNRLGNREALEYSLSAWHIRVRDVIATQGPIPAYEIPPLSREEALAYPLVQELRACMRNQEDVTQVESILNRYGIRFVIIPSLKKAPVDGVASYNSGQPYIGLSLRNAQLDRFWFTLMHEVAHVLMRHSERSGFGPTRLDNIDDRAAKDAWEAEADDFASETMLPQERFLEFAMNGDRSLIAIQEFAEQQNVHPAIVIGRLKFGGWLTWADFAREHPSVRNDFANA